MGWWSKWRQAVVATLLTGLALQTGPCTAQSSAEGPCSSLRAAVKQLAARTAGSDFSGSYTVFDALLDELGFDEEFVLSLNATAVLIPSDAAFAEFFSAFPEANSDPVRHVKLNSDVFKQIILFHFSVSDLPGISGTANTALTALPRLHKEGFINANAICGRQNSRQVKIEYSRDGSSITFREPLGQNFNTEAVATICDNYPQAILYSLSVVLRPCPDDYLFPYPLEGCSTISDVVPEQPFTTLSTRTTDSIVDNYQNPNLLAQTSARASKDGYTLFIPTQRALERAGITNPAFLAVDDALNHVLNGHTVQGKVCLGGDDAEVGTTRMLRTLLNDAFCTPRDTIEMLQGADGPSSTILRTATRSAVANTTTRVNLRVCGGIVHEIDDVLLPCSMEQYMRQRNRPSPTPEITPEESGGPAAGRARTGVFAAISVAVAAAVVMALL